MVKKAFIRANIPFTLNSGVEFSGDFIEKLTESGWSEFDIQGDFLLKHINTSFNKNVICFSRQHENIPLCAPMCDYSNRTVSKNYNFTISETYVYCFDTGIGIISFHIPYDAGTEEETLVNTCSILRCSAKHPDASKGTAILQDGAETYLSCLAQEQLSSLLGTSFSLFDHFNENSLRRVDMFSAVLCDANTADADSRAYKKLCYRLANAYDSRDKDIVLNESDFYQPQDYTRWSFSKRGCCVVANLTGVGTTDAFLEDRWFVSVKSNYFYLYLMVLHQKYAIYNYLNTVAEDTEKNYIKFNQESLIEFNSKYVFSIVSDEQFIQGAYLRMKEVNNVDEVYSDLEDELKRLFEYSQLKNEESNELRNNKLNIISLIISVLCSASIIFDMVDMLSAPGCDFGFSTKEAALRTSIIIAGGLILFVFLMYVVLINKRKK